MRGGWLVVLVATACGGDDATPDAGGDGAVGVDARPPVACDVDADCDDGRFCNGVESCASGTCAPGASPCSAAESCDEGGGRCVAIGPGGDGLPLGIPTPTFGWDHDLGVDATIYVDNTHPSCDDAGPGTAAAPLCDLFRGGRSTTYEAGDVIHVLGGPYVVSGDYTLVMNGTETQPVLVVGQGPERILFDGEGDRANFDWDGSYGILSHLDFFHMTRHRVRGDHLVLEDVAVHNPPGSFIDFNPVVSVIGHDVLIHGSEIFHNRRSTDVDSHGIQASEGSFNVWILDNELYDNNGDSFQGCHECFGTPPHHVYIGRNVMHEDRENAVDLKTIHDVVISENVMYGYGSSSTSGGDAVVIGSNGYDRSINQGPRRVWVLNNEIRDSSTGIRVEGSEDVWLVGNALTSLQVGVQIDDKYHRDIVVAGNTLQAVGDDGIRIYGCQPETLTILNNIVADVADRHLELGGCSPPVVTLENNLLWGAELSVRVDGMQHRDLASLESTAFATMNLFADPGFEGATLVPSETSPAVNAGASLDSIYAAFAYGPRIDRDRAGTPRPSGGAQDIGAYERP
jgi:hypothetical protein